MAIKFFTAAAITIGIYMIYKGTTQILDPMIMKDPAFWIIAGLALVFFSGPNTFKGKLKRLGIK